MMFDSLFGNSRQRRFEKQLRPHLQVLYQYAYRLAGNANDAEDIVQDLLFNLYNRETDLSQLSNSKTWLLKSLYHQFIDFTRKQKRNPSVPNSDDDELLIQQPDPEQGPGETLSREQLGSQLEQALEQLPAEQKMLLLLHDVEGHTLTEIADIMETPLGTLKSRLHRTRKALRAILQREPFRDIRRDNL